MPDTTLTWDDEAQHHRAQDRQGVGTTTMGERNGNHIRIGYDPEAFGLTGELDAFFPLDSTTADGLREYHTGTAPSASGVSRHTPGINGNGSIQFSGSGNGLGYGSLSPIMHGGSFTIAMWVERDRLQNARESLASVGFNRAGDWHLEVRDNARLMFSYYNGSASFQNTGSLHYNQMGTEYHYVGLTYDNPSRTATCYLDDATDSATMSGSRPQPPSESTFRLGRMADRDYYPYQGILSDVMYFRGPLDAAAHAELRDITSGHFTSEKQTF